MRIETPTGLSMSKTYVKIIKKFHAKIKKRIEIAKLKNFDAKI